MERMEQFKNQAEDQPASRSTANPPFGGLGGIGMMRLPGRVRSGDTEGLGLPLPGRGRVSDERIEVSLLGDLAGLSISNENVGGFDVSGCGYGGRIYECITHKHHIHVPLNC